MITSIIIATVAYAVIFALWQIGCKLVKINKQRKAK